MLAPAQVSTKLKVGVMWDHNGTYMEGFGFQYRDQQIAIELNRMDELTGALPFMHCCVQTCMWLVMPLPQCYNAPFLSLIPSILQCTNVEFQKVSAK